MATPDEGRYYGPEIDAIRKPYKIRRGKTWKEDSDKSEGERTGKQLVPFQCEARNGEDNERTGNQDRRNGENDKARMEKNDKEEDTGKSRRSK